MIIIAVERFNYSQCYIYPSLCCSGLFVNGANIINASVGIETCGDTDNGKEKAQTSQTK